MLQVYVTSGNNLVSGPRKEQLSVNASTYIRVTALGVNGRPTIIGYTPISSNKGPNPSFDGNRSHPFKIPFVAASSIRFDVILSKIKINGIANENNNLISTITIPGKPFDTSDPQKLKLTPPIPDTVTSNEEEGSGKHKFVKILTGYDQTTDMGTLNVVILPELTPFDKIVTHKHSFERQKAKRLFIFMSTPDNFQQTDENHLDLEIIKFHQRGQYAQIQKYEPQHTMHSDLFNGTKIFDFTLDTAHSYFYSAAVESVGSNYTTKPVDVTVKYATFLPLDEKSEEDRFFILKEQTIHIDRADVYSTGIIFWNRYYSFNFIDRSNITVGQVVVENPHQNAVKTETASAPVSLTLSSDMKYRTQGGQSLSDFAKRIAPKIRRDYERPSYSMEARRILHPANSDQTILTIENVTNYWNDIFPSQVTCCISSYNQSKAKSIELRCFLFDDYYHNIELICGQGSGDTFEEPSSLSGWSSSFESSEISVDDSHLLDPPTVTFPKLNESFNLNNAFIRKSKSSISIKFPEIPPEVKYIFFTCLTSSDVNVNAQFKILDSVDGFNVASTEVVVFSGNNCRNLIVFYRKPSSEWEILELNDHQSLRKKEKMTKKIAKHIKESLAQVNPHKTKTVTLVQNRRKSLF